MTSRRFAVITAAAVAAVPLVPAPAGAATTGTLVRRVVVDVNGDGAADSVRLRYLGANHFVLSVVTAGGRRSSVRFTSRVDATSAPAADTWYGAAGLDGRKGAELVVNRFTRTTFQTRADVTLGVYTWRAGRLVAQAPPATPKGTVWKVDATLQRQARGYRFFTKDGHRYVDATRLTAGPTGGPWNGRVTRSVWRHGAWVTLSTRRARTVASWTGIRWTQVAIAGPRLLKSQLTVDVSGDGHGDLTSFYRDGMTHYTVTVRAVGRTTSNGFVANASEPFVGAAHVDGVPGAELLFTIDVETPVWSVFAWRGGAALARVPAPAYNGSAGGGADWTGRGDEAVGNFRLFEEDGDRFVVSGWRNLEDAPDGDVHFAKSVWDTDHWTTLLEWSAPLTPDEKETFRKGFTLDDLVTP